MYEKFNFHIYVFKHVILRTYYLLKVTNDCFERLENSAPRNKKSPNREIVRSPARVNITRVCVCVSI